VIVTFAFGINAPVESATVPVRVPVTTCPQTFRPEKGTTNATNKATANIHIERERERQPGRFVELTDLFA
jgi:hypothetical protein